MCIKATIHLIFISCTDNSTMQVNSYVVIPSSVLPFITQANRGSIIIKCLSNSPFKFPPFSPTKSKECGETPHGGICKSGLGM